MPDFSHPSALPMPETLTAVWADLEYLSSAVSLGSKCVLDQPMVR